MAVQYESGFPYQTGGTLRVPTASAGDCRMKKASLNLAGLYLAVFFFTACGPSPVNQQEAQQNVAIAMQQEKVQIQLDETIPGAATSLTRNFYFVFDGSASMGNPPDNTCSGDKNIIKIS